MAQITWESERDRLEEKIDRLSREVSRIKQPIQVGDHVNWLVCGYLRMYGKVVYIEEGSAVVRRQTQDRLEFIALNKLTV